MMGKKKTAGVYIGSVLTIILSLLACANERISFSIVNGAWMKALTFLARTEPFRFILNPLGYFIALFRIYILVSIFLIICGILLLKGKDWVRKFLVVYCWSNIILLITGYFLEKLFYVSGLAVLNRKTFSILSQFPNFKATYFHELSPLTHNIFSFLLHWLLPLISYGLFIIYFTHPKVKEQFKKEEIPNA